MIDLIQYGMPSSYETQEEDVIPARVIEVRRDAYKIICRHGEADAKLKGAFYNRIERSDDLPAVGDFVRVQYNPQGCSMIEELLPRSSKFSRTDFSGHAAPYVKTVLEQVVAANFDTVFVMTSLNRDFNVRRIERYLTAAWQSGAVPAVILTKADLSPDCAEQIREAERIAVGVSVAAVSAKTGEGLDQLAPYLKPGRTVVFLGSSGVGKSSLVNALAGEEVMRVNGIREDDSKGHHTTTHRQLIRLKSGVMVIDTPGMRELGIGNFDEGITDTFTDIESLSTGCRFSDCTHQNEPGCAVRAALESGALDPSRWKSYLQLRREARFSNDKAGYLKEKQNFGKSISKYSRQLKKNGGKSIGH